MTDADAFDHIDDDDLEPSVEPKSSRAWLAIITDAEKTFDDYQRKADSIDKLYADLMRLSNDARDRQFQLFWSNVQVLGPSIYARPPVPVVVPKFKDRRPLYRVASEMMERCSVVAFDISDINSVMLLLRDDLTIVGRGMAWVRYETRGESDTESERVCIEYLDRKDGLHEPARNWLEVGWVARRAWLTKKEMRKRFAKTSGKLYREAEYAVRKEDKDNGAADNRLKAGVWEIWSKTENKVVWVANGCDKLLDEGPPHLKLEGFFPCPRPVYATTQRRSLIPVPDMVFYKDQLEEINELTARIHALSDAVKVRGFYPAGAGEIGDAIETAIKTLDNGQVMVPISNWAAFGSGSAKDTIVWLPIDMIVTTIAQLVELRRQVIDDVYQIMGLSDIMRGSTEASETLGAQQIKAQFGSVRIRDKQSELVRIARDLVRLSAEIMAENFGKTTLLEMSQMEIPTNAEIEQQIEGITAQAEAEFNQLEQQAQQAMSDPQMAQQAQANPEAAQQQLQQAQQQITAKAKPEIDKLAQTPTIEQVMAFLHDNKIRPFVLDIETDSTIQPDEDAEKQRRTEFMTVFSTASQSLMGLAQMGAPGAALAGQMLKFSVAPFRAGRELEGSIDEFVEQMSQMAGQPQPNPEAEAAKAEQARKQAEDQRAERELAAKEKEVALQEQDAMQTAQIKQQEADHAAQLREAESREKIEATREQRANAAQKHAQDMDNGALQIVKSKQEIERITVDMAAKRQGAALQAESAEQTADHSERSFEQQTALNKQKAAQQPKAGA